jgi:hypothetical protein
MCETIFFSVQVCLNPWTVLRQADLQRYLFLGGKGMFMNLYVQKIVPVDTLLAKIFCLNVDMYKVGTYILLVTEWSVSHETKKHILTKDVVGLLLGEVVSTRKNTSSQRMWLACL